MFTETLNKQTHHVPNYLFTMAKEMTCVKCVSQLLYGKQKKQVMNN